MEKLSKQFADMYRNTLRVKGFSEPEQKTNSYICRLERMYTSEKYQEYSIYPSMGIDKIFAVIAMCLELKELGVSDAEIIEFVNTGFETRRAHLRTLLKGMQSVINWMEQYLMYQKAFLFEDSDISAQILDTKA